MATIRLDMTMSLDGYVVGPRDSVEAPMGVGGFRLFNWLDHRFDPGPNGQVFAEASATGAVISGRRTYEHADRWQGDHHDGVPVFVLTHHVPDEPPPGSVRHVTDVRACAAQARAAAGEADVAVLGAGAGQALLRAGELDEMELHVVPVLLGRAGGCSTTCPRRRPSSSWNGCWTRGTPTLRTGSCTFATACTCPRLAPARSGPGRRGTPSARRACRRRRARCG